MTPASGRRGHGLSRPAATAPGLVRLIGGQWKRTPLNVSDRPGLRPTPNRLRKTLFDWLGHDLSGWIVYDAFAGSGALGLEAGSRGAARVTLCEQDVALATALKAIARRLDPQALTLHVERGDGVAALRRQPSDSCDLVLLDPPFETGLHDPALAAATGVLRSQGRIYLEAPMQWPAERLHAFGLETLKYLHAGSVHAHLIGRQPIA